MPFFEVPTIKSVLEPLVKWSGSKRSQAKDIVSAIPHSYETYYEAFCGGCSVLYYILNNCPDKFNRYVCNDLNGPLIGLYNKVKSNPDEVSDVYHYHWGSLNIDDDLERKKRYFSEIRALFNATQDPLLLFFIMRTTTNGMPRYNDAGEFNNSFHVTRNGIVPDTMERIIHEWSSKLNEYEVEFRNGSYAELSPTIGDLMYLDPPYAHTKGMYFGSIDCKALYSYLRELPCDYCMSFDGEVEGEDYSVEVPRDIYGKHILLDNGISSFRRTIGNGSIVNIKESLYCRFAKR